MRLFVILVGFILSGAVSAQSYELIAPKSWYLELNQEFQDQVDQEFGIQLEQGIYFSNQRMVQVRDDVAVSELLDFAYVNVQIAGAFQSVFMGFARSSIEGTDRELWAILPSQEKFLLSIERGGKWSDESIAPLTKHWLPVRGGIISSQYKGDKEEDSLTGKKVQLVAKETKSKFIENETGQETEIDGGFQLFRSADGVSPFLYYDRLYNRMIYLTNATPRKIVATDLTDFNSRIVVELKDYKADPFISMRNEGIYFSSDGSLYFSKVDLSLMASEKPFFTNPVKIYQSLEDDVRIEETIELQLRSVFSLRKNKKNKRTTKYTINQTGKIFRYKGETAKFIPSTEEEDNLITGIEHIELAGALNKGLKSPVYGMESVTRFLADVLGNAESTWAMLRYEEGQLPEELVASFVWDLNTQSIPINNELKGVDRVWQVDGERLFDIKDNELAQDYMQVLHDIVRERNGILFMHNFPTTLETESGATVEIIKIFWKTFRDCLKEGTCRVVTTVREPVYKKLDGSIFDILRESKQLMIANLEKDERKTVTRQALKSLEQRKNVSLTDESFEFLFNYALKFGRDHASPGNEIALLKELFGFMSTFHPTARVVDTVLTKEWVDHKRGVDTIRRTLDIEKLRATLKRKVVSHDGVIDALCDGLRPAVNGTHFSNKPLAFAALTGTPGVGKTYIAKLLAEEITGKDSALMVDMKTFQGFPQDDPVRKAIEGSKNQIRVVVFDDVDQIDAQQLDLLAGVVEEGYYAQGTNQELSFANTIVIWTANWGEKLIRGSNKRDGGLKEDLRRVLTEGSKPVMRRRIWSRIESNLHVMYPFSEKQLFELALVYTRGYIEDLESVTGVELRIDPRLLIRMIAYESDAQAGARSIINQLETKVFRTFQQVLAKPGVEKIALLQVNRDIEVYSNLDDDFKFGWKEVEVIHDDNIDGFVEKYGIGLQE